MTNLSPTIQAQFAELWAATGSSTEDRYGQGYA